MYNTIVLSALKHVAGYGCTIISFTYLMYYIFTYTIHIIILKCSTTCVCVCEPTLYLRLYHGYRTTFKPMVEPIDIQYEQCSITYTPIFEPLAVCAYYIISVEWRYGSGRF